MSAIATFILLPKSAIDDLRDASVTKMLFGKPRDGYWDFLSERGQKLEEYDGSGYILATLIPYLYQEKDIDLGKSELDDLATFICNVRGTSALILTIQDREKYLPQLKPDLYSETELRVYFEEFNETKNEESGKAMLDGIALFHANLSKLTSDSFILLTIG
jgi:hypothetical protein